MTGKKNSIYETSCYEYFVLFCRPTSSNLPLQMGINSGLYFRKKGLGREKKVTKMVVMGYLKTSPIIQNGGYLINGAHGKVPPQKDCRPPLPTPLQLLRLGRARPYINSFRSCLIRIQSSSSPNFDVGFRTKRIVITRLCSWDWWEVVSFHYQKHTVPKEET